jgi:hypothetical protein
LNVEGIVAAGRAIGDHLFFTDRRIQTQGDRIFATETD